MQVVDWGSIPSDVLNTVSERCSSESVVALRSVSRHWNRTCSCLERCRYGVNQNLVGFQLPPLHAFANLKVVEIVGVQVFGARIEALLANRVIRTLAVRDCLIDGDVVRILFGAPNLEHLSLASSSIIANGPSPAASNSDLSSTSLPCDSSRAGLDADGDVVMLDETFTGRSASPPSESALLSLDLSGVQGLSDDLAASAVSACRQLVALRVAVSPSWPATMAALATLPHLAHLELSTASVHNQSSLGYSVSLALEELCSTIAARSAALFDSRSAPPENAVLASLADCAPWWRPSAQTSSTSRQSSASLGPLRANLHPQSPFHLVVDFPIITSSPRTWLTDVFTSIPFRALTVRQPHLSDMRSAVSLGSAHSVSSPHSVPALAGPATLAAQATPDAARALHALLPDLLIGRAPLSHFQLLGVEITEAVVRHMRMVHTPLESLCLHNCDPEARARAQSSPRGSMRSSMDSNDAAEANKPEPMPLAASEMRARIAARWRLPAAATLRQLVDSQATDNLHRLELIDLPGVNDTVLRRIRSQATSLKHLTISGICSVTLDGIAELRWMKLQSLHVCHLGDRDIAFHGVQTLSSGGSGLVTSLVDLRFEGYRMPLAALHGLQRFTKLRSLSLDGSTVAKPGLGPGEAPVTYVQSHEVQILEAARQLLQSGMLTRISACGTALGEVFGHARGQVKAQCHIETLPF